MAKENIRKVIDVCTYYRDIINERFSKDDMISAEILKYYKDAIQNTHYVDPDELNKAMLLDKIVYAYFNNNNFNEYISSNLKYIDKQADLTDFLLTAYKEMNDNPETKITTTKWI